MAASRACSSPSRPSNRPWNSAWSRACVPLSARRYAIADFEILRLVRLTLILDHCGAVVREDGALAVA